MIEKEKVTQGEVETSNRNIKVNEVDVFINHLLGLIKNLEDRVIELEETVKCNRVDMERVAEMSIEKIKLSLKLSGVSRI